MIIKCRVWNSLTKKEKLKMLQIEVEYNIFNYIKKVS